MMRATLFVTLLACLAVATDASAKEGRTEAAITVFAAASLADVLERIALEFNASRQASVRFSFAASSALARQIESGARADVFLSADQDWMDYLDARGLIDPSTRRDLLGNRLALIAPSDSAVDVQLNSSASLLAALGARGRLATGDPDFVPAGKYAKAALATLGVWSAIESRLVRADNVRAALMFVARAEAPLGVVYETDVLVEPRVRLVALFPESSHPPITYPLALTNGESPSAREFVEFLTTEPARKVFERAGFRVLDPARK